MLRLWRLTWFCLLCLAKPWHRLDSGLHCGPEYTNVTGQRASEKREETLLDHTAVKPVPRFQRILWMHSGQRCGDSGFFLFYFSSAKWRGNTGRPSMLCIFAGSSDRIGGITEPWFTTTGVSLTKQMQKNRPLLKREKKVLVNNFLNRKNCSIMLVWRSPLPERQSKNSPLDLDILR